MPIDTDIAEAITFDSFTTLVDVETSTKRVLSEHTDDPDRIANLWRARAIDYRMVSTFTGVYQTYEETTRDALEYALAVNGIDLPDRAIDEIASVFHDLDVYEDVHSGMKQLADAGYDLYILSNGNQAVLDSMIERADIGELIEGTISADEINVYKPALRIYRHAADRIGTPIEHIVHVTTPWYDIYGAIHAGMQGIWMNRNDLPWDRFDGNPDLIVESFEGLLSAFDV